MKKTKEQLKEEAKNKEDMKVVLGKYVSKNYANKMYDEDRAWSLSKATEAEHRARQKRIEQLRKMGML